jgi:hypothetical protein
MSDGNDGAGGRDEPAARIDEARVAQAERVAGAINVVKWIVVVVIALATVSLALVVGFGSLDSEEPTTVESLTGATGPYEDYIESEPSDPDGPGAATRFLQVSLVLAGGALQALLVWIVFGWAQHTLGMLAILARRRVA